MTPTAQRSASSFTSPVSRRSGDKVRHGAEIIPRDFSAQRQRLRDTEVEHLDLAGRGDPDVSRLQIAMDKRPQLAIADDRLEAVRAFQKQAQLHRDVDRMFRLERAARDHLGQVFAVEVFHRDEKVTGLVEPMLINRRHVRADLAELPLKLGTPLLGLENLARLAVGPVRYQLERHFRPVRVSGRGTPSPCRRGRSRGRSRRGRAD